MKRPFLTALSMILGFTLFAQSSFGTVILPQTRIRSQGHNGFCWAYALIAQVEQHHLSQKDALYLSADYVGLYNLINQLVLGIHNLQEGGEYSIAVEMIQKYGLVPLSVFSSKPLIIGLTKTIEAARAQYNTRAGRAANAPLNFLTAHQIVEQVSRLKIPKPNDIFSFRGQAFTPQSFVKNRLRFDFSQYSVVRLASPAQNRPLFEKQVRHIKQALLEGHSVPFSFVVFKENSMKVRPDGTWDCANCTQIKRENTYGGHLVLLIDYETANSPLGYTDFNKAMHSLQEPVTRWVIKNSWGLGRRDNLIASNLPTQRGVPTWFSLSHDYFSASAMLGQDCFNCNLDSSIFFNPQYDSLKTLIAKVVLPKKFISQINVPLNLNQAKQNHLIGQELINKQQQRNVAENLPRPQINESVLEPIALPTQLQPIVDWKLGFAELKPNAMYHSGVQFRVKHAIIKSIGMWGQNENINTTTPYQIIERSDNFLRTYFQTAPATEGIHENSVIFRALDAQGKAVGAPLKLTLKLRVVKT